MPEPKDPNTPPPVPPVPAANAPLFAPNEKVAKINVADEIKNSFLLCLRPGERGRERRKQQANEGKQSFHGSLSIRVDT